MNKQLLIQQLRTLEKAIEVIRSIVEPSGDNYVGEVAGIGPKSTPEEAIERAAKGLCTFCGEPLPTRYNTRSSKWTTNRNNPDIVLDDQGRPEMARRQSDRGADGRHYKQVQRLVKAGSMTWEDAVAWGWVLVDQPNKGRPPKKGGAKYRLEQQAKLKEDQELRPQMVAETEIEFQKKPKRKPKP